MVWLSRFEDFTDQKRQHFYFNSTGGELSIQSMSKRSSSTFFLAEKNMRNMQQVHGIYGLTGNTYNVKKK